MLPKVMLYSPKQNLEVMAGPAPAASAQVASSSRTRRSTRRWSTSSTSTTLRS